MSRKKNSALIAGLTGVLAGMSSPAVNAFGSGSSFGYTPQPAKRYTKPSGNKAAKRAKVRASRKASVKARKK